MVVLYGQAGAEENNPAHSFSNFADYYLASIQLILYNHASVNLRVRQSDHPSSPKEEAEHGHHQS